MLQQLPCLMLNCFMPDGDMEMVMKLVVIVWQEGISATEATFSRSSQGCRQFGMSCSRTWVCSEAWRCKCRIC